jgi:N-methylhydantoinase A
MLLTDLRRDYLQTRVMPLEPCSEALVRATFAALRDEARHDYEADGVEPGQLNFRYLADMRYLGQEHTVKVEVTVGAQGIDMAEASQRFHAAHERSFTFRLDAPVQIVSCHLVATAAVQKPELARREVTGRSLEDARLPSRRVDFDRDGVHDAAIYGGLLLEPGMHFTGPAVVQEPSVTLVVPPEHRVSVDDWGNYHVHLRERTV